jgi:hypothetical protein
MGFLTDVIDKFTGVGAAKEAGQANVEAARIAAESAKFKPYSLTTGFGRGFFDTEKGTAGYEIDPRLAAFRDQLYNQAEQTLAQLGSTNPQAEAAKYVEQQMGLLQPTRAAEDVAMRQKALGSGRMGLGVSAGYVGGEGQGLLNPDQFATQLARERANAQIAAQGTEYGQNIMDKLISRGTGLFSSGAGIEQLGMTPLTLGADIGNKASISGAQAGQALLQGGMNAANANLAGGISEARFLQNAVGGAANLDYTKFKNPFSGMFTSGGSDYGMGSDTAKLIGLS